MSIYISIFLTALIYNINFRKNKNDIYIASKTHTTLAASSIDTIDNSIYNSFYIIVRIGGYIIIFSLIANIINYFFKDITVLSTLIIGLFEMTNGIFSASMLDCSIYVKMSLMCIICVFGGICTTLQTYSIIHEHKLSIKKYLISKTLTASIATVIFYITSLLI